MLRGVKEDEPLHGIDEDNIELVGNEQALGAVDMGLAGGEAAKADEGGGRRRRSSVRVSVRALIVVIIFCLANAINNSLPNIDFTSTGGPFEAI